MSAKRERLAVVTGGIGGLGTEICIHLARSGRKVVAADLDGRPDRIDAFRESVSEFNGHIRFEPLNVADFDHCAEFAERVQQHHGPVDILVNAAGITRDTTLRKMDAKQWSDVIRVNLDGVFNLSRQFVDGMCERGFGRIVNITSGAVKAPIDTLGLSNGARSGLTGFVAGLARQPKVASRNVTINGLLPGPFDTDRMQGMLANWAKRDGKSVAETTSARLSKNPAQRMGNIDEFGATCAFLCSQHASFITGQNILMDGGEYPGTF